MVLLGLATTMNTPMSNNTDTPESRLPPDALPESEADRHKMCDWLVWFVLLAVLTLGMFAEVLFTSQHMVLSNQNTDLFLQFVHWRTFGFGELKHGNLALWNPHIFCGAPFFGGAQAALLYPPNMLFLLLPLARAINWSIALHVFLAGAFTYAWAARRGLRPLSCFLSGAIFMFCGAHFLRIYAGHLPNLCSLVWAPLLFLAIDGLAEKPSFRYGLLGAFTLAMQVLAGHPQYVFYTGVAAAVYCSLRWIRVQDRSRFLAGLVGVVLGGVALSAVQIFTGFQEARETLRCAGVPYDFAATFSFPPENFLTLLIPNIFGDMKGVSYWGRWSLWEASLFIGVSGLVLAVVGAVWGNRQARRFSAVMVALLLILALGRHTPLFMLLYGWVPGFNSFRGTCKFLFLASVFLALLAGVGLDELYKGRRPARLLLSVVGVGGFLLLTAGVAAYPLGQGAAATGWWRAVFLRVGGMEETTLAPGFYEDPAFVLAAGRLAFRDPFAGHPPRCRTAGRERACAPGNAPSRRPVGRRVPLPDASRS